MAENRKSKVENRKSPDGYTVLARRYRPQQFRDLVGQEAVARALVNALESNRVAHAYLFTGPRGVGKTSTARILAKALNCEKGPTPTPCDQCSACRGIASGEDVDVLEIDGASNRRLEEAREIRRNVQYRPSRSRFKIYIIDEVHMLIREAFNALLKTLEEPPPHVKFIFATTEVEEVPLTIRSRCQRFDFAGIPVPRIVEHLRQVVQAEGTPADDESLQLIARRAAGSMRDAQSLLDQLLAFGGASPGQGLTAEDVHRLLGTANDDRVAGLASAILQRDPAKTLDLLRDDLNEGLDLGELLGQLIDYWRDLMVVRCAGLKGRDLTVSPRQQEALGRQAAALSLDTILAGLDILSTTKSRLRGSHHGRVLVEMALIRLARLEDLAPLSQLAQWAAGLGEAPRGKDAEPRRAESPPRATRANGPTQEAAPAPASTPPPAPDGVKKNSSAAPPDGQAPRAPLGLTKESLSQVWEEVLSQVGLMLASELRKGECAISGPNTLVVRFPPGYNLAREHCQEPARVARIEEALKKVTGSPWSLRVEMASGEPAATPEEADSDRSPPRSQRQRTEALQQPLVKRAVDLFEAQIVHVDEGFGAAPAETPEAAEPADTEES